MIKIKKIKLLKIISLILLLFWMCTVFYFSSQGSDNSSSTNSSFTEFIINLNPNNAKLPTEEKAKLIEDWSTLIRKIAHYSIYTTGGFLMAFTFQSRNLNYKKNLILSTIVGGGYAITDEIHQYFVPGRSCQLLDMIIDTTGVVTGIIICFTINEFVKYFKFKKYK